MTTEPAIIKYQSSSSDFPKKLRELRSKKGLSQSQLGKLVGLHYLQIGRYERGLSRPSADALQRLAEVLDAPSEYLLVGDEHEKKLETRKFHDDELFNQFLEVETLLEEDKVVVKKLLDAFLTKKRIQTMVAS